MLRDLDAIDRGRPIDPRLAEEARAGAHGFLNHSGLFTVAGGLDDRLTYDGLHLNAAGLDILSRVLLSGVAAPTERGQQVEAFKVRPGPSGSSFNVSA